MNNQEQTFKLILLGSYSIAVLLLIQLLVNAFLVGSLSATLRILLAVFVILYLFTVQKIYPHSQIIAQWMIISLYLIIGLTVFFFWGNHSPIGILTLGFVILLSSIFLGSKYILRTTLLVVTGLVAIQLAVNLDLYQPDMAYVQQQSTFGDILSYAAMFTIFALTAWIASRQNETSLSRALSAEKALRQEKRLLASKLRTQERILRQAQHDEMQQLYKFAELGQLTTSLLHQLANHISVLNLDIKAFSDQKDANVMKHINHILISINDMINSVRLRIAHSNQTKKFEVTKCIETVISDVTINKNLRALKVAIKLEDYLEKKHRFIVGDPMRLGQVMTILINNAVQAIIEQGVNKESAVRILLQSNAESFEIHVIDNGIGIPTSKRAALFSPLRSSKKDGMGIGLYIAAEFIQTHFNGKLQIDSLHDKTCFKIEIPLTN